MDVEIGEEGIEILLFFFETESHSVVLGSKQLNKPAFRRGVGTAGHVSVPVLSRKGRP